MSNKKSYLIGGGIVVAAIVIAAIILGVQAYEVVQFVPNDAITPSVTMQGGPSQQTCNSGTCSPSTSGAVVNTSTWKIYTNTKYGFTLDYPATWQLSLTGLSSVTPYISFGNPLTGTKTYSLDVYLENNSSTKTSEQYVSSLLTQDAVIDASATKMGEPAEAMPKFSNKDNVLVGVHEGYELYNVFEYDHNAERIYVAHGTLAFRFDFPVSGENPNIASSTENNTIAHAIIGSLIFTK